MTHDPAVTDTLAGSKSPFLQHGSHQPVKWMPWGRRAFERALSEDKPNQILRLGRDRTIVSLRHEPPMTGVVDHFAIAVEGFSRQAVTELLKSHGLTTQENIQYGFYVKDPDGVVVQIV